MNQQLLDLAAQALEAAQGAGAGAARVGVSADRTVEIQYRDRRPETIKEASTRALRIEVLVDGRYSIQVTSDLRRPALQQFIARAVASTRLLAEDPFRSLPDSTYYEGRAALDLEINDPAYGALTPDQRHETVRVLEESCLDAGGNRVISVEASIGDTHSESVVLASDGFEGGHEGTTFWGGAGVSMQDEGDRRPSGWFYATSVERARLPGAAFIGAEAARRTACLLGAKKIPTETLPVIIENWNVGRVLSGLLAGLSGRNIQQKQSFLAEKRGQQVASERLTVVDDPLLVGGLASRLFDGDGLAGRRRVMIEAGVVRDFYIDWYYSRKLGWEPTTGGASNLIVLPGQRSVDEIMRDLGRGVLINGFIGGNSNSTTGDFSVGITGTLFENGVLTQPVAEMNIAGNHLEFWAKLAEVANDPWPYSSWRTPSLVFSDVAVSGA